MQLTISPETMALRQEYEQLKSEFIKLYTERDRLNNEDRDDLYIRYVKLIGEDKYENFCLSVEVRALRMKVEMAQAAINRGSQPDVYEIQRRVDEQLEDYYECIRQHAEALKQAREAKSISIYDAKEMQQLFRMLVKRLHPDLHPELSEDMQDLFIQGKAAYRAHNLPLLREIIMRLDINGDMSDILHHEETIEQAIERLRLQNDQMRSEIAELKAMFPLNLRKQLHNPTWIHEQQEQLKQERKQLKAQKKMLEDRFSLMTD